MGDETIRFGLTWPGKARCLAAVDEPPRARLVPWPEESFGSEASHNAVFEGDNLDVLKLLRPAWTGRIKLIVIDPPYNTGSDFVYPDCWRESAREWALRPGSDPRDAAGRLHAGWLDMITPRLALARRLLADDGLLFVTIDDREAHHLRLVLDQLFGPEAFLANVVWQKKYTRANDAEHFSGTHDHVLVYAKDRARAKVGLLPRTARQRKAYVNPDGDPRGPWKPTPLHAKSGADRRAYAFRNGVIWAPPPRTFRRYNDATLAALDEGGELWFGPNGTSVPARKSFLANVKRGVTPVTLWLHDEVGHGHEANEELKALFGEPVFDNPKPTRLVRRILDLATSKDGGDVVLDFFAGSGTTGDAVLRANAADGGNRRFLLVEQPCPLGRAGLPTIAALTRERVRRVARALAGSSRVPFDQGFAAWRLA